MSERSGLAWYAVQVEPRREKSVAQILDAKGYEQLLPLWRPAGRRPNATVPLFPGYLFCRLDLADRRAPVVVTPGVIGLVGVGAAPSAIPENEIEALKTILDSRLPTEPCPAFEIGQRLRITRGPLSGVEGHLCAVKKRSCLIVRITLVQRAVAVELDETWVASATQPAQADSLRSMFAKGQLLSYTCGIA
jgi:transcription termination/antitermination protein NusG